MDSAQEMRPKMTTDLCFRNARELAAGIRGGDFSSVELTEAHIAQIERVNPR